MSAISSFPDPIRRYLREFVARSRWVRLLRAVIFAAAVAVGWIVVWALVDRVLHFAPWFLAGLQIALIGAMLVILARPIVAIFRRRIDWVAASEQIEARDPSLGQRLVTVTSQLLAPQRYRGSRQLIDSLVTQVTADVGRTSSARLIGTRPLLRAVGILVGVVGVGCALALVPRLNVAQLVNRQLRPFAGIAAVTTTMVHVTPGNATVNQRDTLFIKARVDRLSGSPPVLYVSGESGEWSKSVMIAGLDDAFTASISGVERDLKYYIKAGDATTPRYGVRVLRPPALAEFRIRYVYPAYTGRQSLTVANHDGLIEAPRGSEATISVVSTEPLASAALKSASERIELQPGDSANVRQIKLTVQKDAVYQLEMTSDRGVSSGGTTNVQVRAVTDRPPLVRLLQPGADLRLAPRDIVSLAYQALDDYGVAQVTAAAQVNSNPVVEYAIRLKGDLRRQEGTHDLDLAPLGLNVGDVVTLTIAATDKAGQKQRSEPRHIIISPRSVDTATHQRIAELSQAAQSAKEWSEQLTKANQALEQARKNRDDPSEMFYSLSRVNRQLVNAQDAGILVRQSLLRAIMFSANAKVSDALAAGVDSVTSHLSVAERVSDVLSGREVPNDQISARLARAAENAQLLAGQLKKCAEGEQAAAVLADRANLKAFKDKAGERRKQMYDRANQDINASLAILGINVKDGNVDRALQERIDSGMRVVHAVKPPDFAASAARWANDVKQRERNASPLEERLYFAAQAEAVRPDSDIVAARDLQLASRAAEALAYPANGGDEQRQKRVETALAEFPGAIGAIRGEHDLNRRLLRLESVKERMEQNHAAKGVRVAASEARGKLIAFAGITGEAARQIASEARQAEDLALTASVATAERDFDKAAALDRSLADKLKKPELADASKAPRAIDDISKKQETLAGKVENDATDAGGQQQVADAIDRTRQAPTSVFDNADSRQRATEAITRAQEKIAALPMQMLDAQELAESVREVTMRLTAAQGTLASASPENLESAERALRMITLEYDDIHAEFAQAVKPFSGKVAEDAAESLRPFAPETMRAVSVFEEQLKPALLMLSERLNQVAQGGEPTMPDQSAKQARLAIQNAQDSLRESQNQITERDPLVAAKWFAKAAADELTRGRDRGRAAAHQKKTLEALQKAGIEAVRRSKTQRLSQVPTFGGIYVPPMVSAWGEGEQRAAGEKLLSAMPGLREWGRLRERWSESTNAPIRETDPPGFTDSLKIYFEVLGKEGEKK